MESDLPISFLIQKKLVRSEQLERRSFQLLYVLSGQVEVLFPEKDSRNLKAGDVLAIASDSNGTLIPRQENLILHMGILPSFLETYDCPENRILCDSSLEPQRDYLPLRRLLGSISSEYLDYSSDHRLTIYGMLFQLIDLLSSQFLMKSGNEAGIAPRYRERYRQIQEYINENYSREISLTDLSDYLHLTPQYVSKFFKNQLGMHFTAYLNEVRVEHAARDLRYTSDDITQIALKHGFASTSTFNRNFRSYYGISPRSYREKMKLQNPVAVPAPAVLDITLPKTDPLQNHRQVIVSVQNQASFSNNFCDLINIGMAQNLMSDVFREELLNAHKALHFRYVRVEGLISSSLIPRLADTEGYHFTRVLFILDFLQENNLFPFLELGRNSSRKTYDILDDFSWQYREHQSRSYLSMLENLLSFLTSRYDPEWLSQWIFEFHKEEQRSIADYLAAWKVLQQIVKKYIPKASFGGPGFNTAVSSDEFLELLHKMKSENVSPDFLSMHFFSIQFSKNSDSDVLNLSSVVRPLSKQQSWILEQIQKIFGRPLPLYITEFSSCLIPETYINDSLFQATFICHNLLKLHEASPLIGYWLLSDRAVTYSRQTFRLFEGMGMINKSGILMPAFYAYSMLKHLGRTLISRGEHYIITSDGPDHYQILTYHYVPFADYYALQQESLHSLRYVYHYFQEAEPLTMDFTLQELRPGTYRIHRTLLDRTHGSLLDIQLGGLVSSTIDEETYLYKTQNPSAHQLSYLKNACVPEERIVYVNSEGELPISIRLLPHNVCLFDIVKEL